MKKRFILHSVCYSIFWLKLYTYALLVLISSFYSCNFSWWTCYSPFWSLIVPIVPCWLATLARYMLHKSWTLICVKFCQSAYLIICNQLLDAAFLCLFAGCCLPNDSKDGITYELCSGKLKITLIEYICILLILFDIFNITETEKLNHYDVCYVVSLWTFHSRFSILFAGPSECFSPIGWFDWYHIHYGGKLLYFGSWS